jgi:predicted ThiF/HesA family dinucleotide-utilizing enzyme
LIASFTVTLAENVRCVILIGGATAPTAAEVNAGTGNNGATPVSSTISLFEFLKEKAHFICLIVNS